MKKGPLIKPPLYWREPNPVGAPQRQLRVLRGGTALRVPLPTVVVDTREQNPFQFSLYRAWVGKVVRKALPVGDYSVAGMEDSCVVERKSMDDLVASFTSGRQEFIERLRKMAAYPDRLLVVTASLAQLKSPYPHSRANPNDIVHSLVAALVSLRVPFLCAETHELAEELVASYLNMVFTLNWLDKNGYGRYLSDGDL